jgi:hypothetical protein
MREDIPMSHDIYVLTKVGGNYGNYDMVCWFDTLDAAEDEALKREWADYHDKVAHKSPRVIHVASPDETAYRHYSVELVPKG